MGSTPFLLLRGHRRTRHLASTATMAALCDDDAWRLAMEATAILKDRAWLVETRDDAASMLSHYEWINVQVYDPRSRAFAALPTVAAAAATGGNVDYVAYAWETRRALAIWTAVANAPGFSARENTAFWLRVLREVTPLSHGQVSDVPRFFETPDAAFPRFRLTFQPRDCYDEDLHDEDEAVDWVEEFSEAFFAEETDVQVEAWLTRCEQRRRLPQKRATPFEVVFRVPVKRIHSPLGSSLEQHRGFLDIAHKLSTALEARRDKLTLAGDMLPLRLVGCLAIPRGSIRPDEFSAIAKHFDLSTGLQVSSLCIDLGDEGSLQAFADAVTSAAITSLTVNVMRSTVASVEQLFKLLQTCPSIRKLRLFNAFPGAERERKAQWIQLSRALTLSRVQVLVLERAHLDEEDIAGFRSGSATHMPLLSLTVKPVTSAGISITAYVNLVKSVGASLEHLDASMLCLEAASVDDIIESCPNAKSFRFGAVADLANSKLVAMMQHRVCRVSSVAVSCSNADARAVASALTNQASEVALAGDHLKELSLSVEELASETSDAVLQMLDTNESLRFLQLKRRSHGPAPLDARISAHHHHQLVRKLPVTYAAAFLSVLGHGDATISSGSRSALERFDMGVASEILSFSGHAVRRRVHCP